MNVYFSTFQEKRNTSEKKGSQFNLRFRIFEDFDKTTYYEEYKLPFVGFLRE